MSVIDLAQYKYTLTLDSAEYSKNMVSAQNQAENMKSKLSGMGSFLKTALVGGLVAVGAAVAGTVVEGVKATAKLDEQLSKFTASTGASAEETQKIRDLAKELYKTNTDSMEDILATSEAMVKQMGLTADEVKKYQQSYLDYAKTTDQANTDVVGAIDDIGDAWGLTAEESVKSLDMLKKSNQEYGTDISAVQSALSAVAPAAKALGLSLEETNGYMNIFAASGLDANQSITAFTYAAKQVKSPEEFRTMLADIQAISDPTERAQKSVELFGAKAGVAMANVDTTQLQNFVITMDEAAGTVTNASAAFDSNFNVQLELMKKQFSGIAQQIGEKFMPILQSIMSWVTANMPKIMSSIEGAISFVSSLISPFITMIQTLIGKFQDTESQTNTSFTAIKDAISSVIEAVKAIISGFVTIFEAIWNKWGENIVAFVQNHFNNIMSVIQNAFNVIKGIADFFIALFTGDWEGCWEAVKNIASSAMDLLSSIFKTAIDFISGIFKAGFELIVTVGKTLMNGLWTGIKNIWNSISKWFNDSWNGLVKWFGNLGSKFTNIGSSILTWVWDGLKNTFSNISSWISEKVKWIADKLTFWKSSQNTMSQSSNTSSSSSGNVKVDGSHANGLNYVPYDNYLSLLHEGERVLTKSENDAYTSNYLKQASTTNNSFTPTINVSIAATDLNGNELNKIADQISNITIDKLNKTFLYSGINNNGSGWLRNI